MSKNYKAINVNMRDHLKDVTGNELKVWMYLHLRTGKENTAFPGNKTIAKDVGLSLDTVKEARASLRKKGWFKKEFQRRREDGTMSTVVEKTLQPWGEKATTVGGKTTPTAPWGEKADGGQKPPAEGVPIQEAPLEVPPSAIQTNPEGSALTSGSELVSELVSTRSSSSEQTNPQNLDLDLVRGAVATQEQSQEQPQPLTEEEAVVEGLDEDSMKIVRVLYSVTIPVKERVMVKAVLPIFVAQNNAEEVLNYLIFNRAHKSGGLVIRSVTQLIKTWNSGYGLNEWVSHVADDCSVCKKQAKAEKIAAQLAALCVECGKAGASPNTDNYCPACWAAINAACAREMQKQIVKKTSGGVLDAIRHSKSSGRGFQYEGDE